jgi:hypothetical protein
MRPSRSLRTTLSLPLLVLLVLPVLAPAVAIAQPFEVTTSIAANETWGLPGSGSTHEANVFWIRSSIAVNANITLTMGPGIVVKFDPSTSLTVNGSLQAAGTAGQNVVITSIRDDNAGGDTNGDGNVTLPNPSDWGSIRFSTVSPDTSRLTFTQVRFAGYNQSGALTFTNTSARLTNCTIQRSYFGIDCAGMASPRLVDTSIQASTMTPIVLDFTATPAFANLVFSGADNGYDALGLRGGTLSTEATLPRRGATVGVNPLANVTYVLLSSLTISGTGKLTIDPGVVVKPLATVGITVNGNLTMNGTAADTITVTSIKDDNFGQPRDTNNNGSITAPVPGDWSIITFNQGSTGSMQYCRLKFGSNNALFGMVDLTNMNLPVSNTLLSDAAHGIAIRGISAPVLNTVQINNCTSTPVYQSVSAAPTYTNIGFLGNVLTALGLIGETLSVDSRLTQQTVAGYANITYLVVNACITMNSPATLTIDPGVVVKFNSNTAGLVIYGALVAQGTSGSPIVFTSWRDDQVGNPLDTNGDGSSTTPDTYNWGYIQFAATSNDATSRLVHCRVLYGSYSSINSSAAGVWCVNASPAIDSTVISKCNWGVRCDGNSAPAITYNTIQNCDNGPILMSVQSDPVLTGNTFLTNGYSGLGLVSETLSQNAVLKYRPTVTFPPPSQATVFAYVPLGQITVPSGVTLAIEPRVVLKPASSFSVFDVHGTLNIVGGSGADRIVFTSIRDDAWSGDTNTDGSASSPAAGNWGNVLFDDASVDAQCIVRNALFQFGGTLAGFGAVGALSANPRLAALEFFQNVVGVDFRGTSQAVCDSLTILNSTYLPIVQSLASDPKFSHLTLANNAWTAIGLLGETVAQDVRTYPRVLGSGILDNLAYVPTGTINIAFGAKWTIAPGVVIKLGRANLETSFGTTINIDGALVAAGKPDSLIVFTSTADDAFGGDTHGDGATTAPALGQWASLTFGGTSNSAATVVDHCRFRYGGYASTAALRITNANTNVTNTVFTSCYSGVSAEGNAAPTFTNVDIDTCTVPVRMSVVSNPAFTNVNFLGCDFTALGVVNETLAQDVLWRIRAVSGRQNMPYLVDGTLSVGLGTTLALQPGLIVKLRAGTIDVNRAFLAEGRTDPESLIVFTSYKDDFYGGRTYVGTTPNTPSSTDWGSVLIDDTAIDSQVRFLNCVLRYGGSYGGTYGAIRCVNSSPRVDSCIIAYNTVGVRAEGASDPVIQGCSIYGNSLYGVQNAGGSFCLDARHNYWGAASGPNDPNAGTDLCGSMSSAGSGDNVTQNVDYTNFVTTGLQNPLLGDVSLNGQVRAYDASLVLQYLVPLISLTPLQQLVANVDGGPAIDALDASLILQYVAGIITTLPGNQTRAERVPAGLAAARRVVEAAQGTFEVRAGDARRVGDHWEVPVLVTGSAPIYGAEIELRGPTAGTLDGVTVAEGALEAHGTPEGTAKLVLAAALALPAGEIAALRFPGGDTWQAPLLTWARINSETVTGSAGVEPPAPPAAACFAPPAPNPAHGPVRLSLGISGREQGARAFVHVHDLAGRLVRVVHEGALEPGLHDLRWDLRDASGRAVAPGIYLVRAEAGAFRSVRRVVVLR